MSRREISPRLRVVSPPQPVVARPVQLAAACAFAGMLVGAPLGFAACLLFLPS